MAIDNAEKRRNVSGIQTTLLPGVTPNASKDGEWRQQSGWGYSGILVGAILVRVTKVFKFTMRSITRIFGLDDRTRVFKLDSKTKDFKLNE